MPVLFRVFSHSVSGYQFFYALGIVLGALLIVRLSRRERLDLVEIGAYMALVTGCGLLGSRLLPALLLLAFHSAGGTGAGVLLRNGLAGGGSFFGAVAAVLLFAALYTPRYFAGAHRRLWDITVIGIALGHGVGRLGCFAAGCCYGIPTALPWGVRFATLGKRLHPQAGILLHPVQLYEAALCLLLALFLYRRWKKRRFAGQIFALYLSGYGVIRFLLEFLRRQHPAELAWTGGLSWYQVFSLLLLLAGCWSRLRFQKGLFFEKND